MFETLNKIFASNLIAFLAAVIGAGSVRAYFVLKQAAFITTARVEEVLSAEISTVASDVATYQERVRETLRAAEELRARITNIGATVDSLTTEQVQERLKTVDERISQLTTQVSGLQQIMSPQNASEILNVARMSEEILARRKLEDRVNASVSSSQSALQSMEAKLSTIQFWIWGAFVTLIGGLLGSVIYLAKLLSNHLLAQAGGQKAEADTQNASEA